MPRLLTTLLVLLPCPALACSLCGTLVRKEALTSEYERARIVAVGTLGKPTLDVATGSGTTPFHVEKVVKGPAGELARVVTLPRYLPVLDAAHPPRFVMFFNPVSGKLEATGGRQLHSPALLDMLAGTEVLRGKPRTDVLTYFARYLDHADDAVAEEAFLQFAKSTDRDVAEAARALKPDIFRKLIADPRIDPERLSLFAYLLGATGGPKDADALAELLRRPDDRTTKALEGVVAGYVQLRPAEAWDWVFRTLADRKQSYLVRYAVVRSLRFLGTVNPSAHRAHVVRGLTLLVPDAELADAAINDLAKLQVWDHTRTVLDQFGRPTHQAPIVRNSIVRYALACPLPEARQFITQLRRRDAELVRDLEEDLAFERGQR
jgi:hypothetical protein